MATKRGADAVAAGLEAKRARALEALAHTALTHLHDPDLLRQLLGRVQDVMDADNAAILLLDESGQTLTLHSVLGPEEAVADQVRVPVGRGVAGKIVATRAPLVVDDLTTVEVANPFLREHLRSLVGVPLLVDGRVLGALHVDSTKLAHFTMDDAHLLELIAERIALALDHARLLREAESARRQAELQAQRLAATVDAMVDGVLMYDRDAHIVQANQAARSLMGYDRQPGFYERPPEARAGAYTLRDAQGHPVAADRLPPRRILRGEVLTGSGSEDYLVSTLDGQERLLNLSGAPVRDSDGQISGAVIIARDVSERKRLERELAERVGAMGTIFEAITDGVIVYGPRGEVNHINSAYRRMLALDDEELRLPIAQRGRAIAPRRPNGEPMAEADWPASRIRRGEVLTGASAVDVLTRARDGRELLINCTGAPIYDERGAIQGAVMVIRDVGEQRRLEERLRFHGTMLEHTHDAIFMWELGGPIIFWNRGAELLYGYGAAEATGRVSHELLRTRHPEPVADFEARLAREGEWTGELTHIARDGRVVEVLSRQQVVRQGDGRTYIIETARDITERKQLERRTRQTLDALLSIAEALVQPDQGPHVGQAGPTSDAESSGAVAQEGYAARRSLMAQRLSQLTRDVLGCSRVGIVAVDPETQVQRAVAVVGLPPEQERQWWAEQDALEAQGVRFGEGAEPELLARFVAGEALVVDMRQPPYDALPNPYNITTSLAAPMRIGSDIVGILSLDYGGPPHEFTDEERTLAAAVAKLAALVIERERLIREHAEAQASELALREANRRMDEFLHVVNHELHNPLTTLKSSVQIAHRRLATSKATPGSSPQDAARNEGAGTLPVAEGELEALRRLLERADRQANRLDRMMSELVDASRVQTGKLELRLAVCDLAALLRESVEEQRQVQPSRSISVQLPHGQPVEVMADSDRIRQVVTNFLTNALKYSAADRPVAVTLDVEPDVTGAAARVAVRDEGPGIPSTDLERIWERYHRAEGVSVQSGSGVGLGLGLYISRQIVEQHGGRVGVDSVRGSGATFWFTLPLSTGANE